MNMLSFLLAGAVLVLSGCASHGYRASDAGAPDNPDFVESPVPGCLPTEPVFECDRRAILAMQGEFKVSFRFDETAVLAPGYQRYPEQRSGGYETVLVVEDSGRRIDLQHILVAGDGHVVKHWRQSWVYEANPIWTFAGDQRYQATPRDPAAVPGTWTQYVHEVSDAPRYAGSGRWNHKYGVSTWTSDRSWRPLPRREYTKRSDYQLLNVENRHTITPQGWTHEQDNSKVQRGADGKDEVLVREFGFNDYRRVRGHDFAPAHRYWNDTQAFWAMVRQRWDAALRGPDGLRLTYPVDDETFIQSIFEAAEAFAEQPDEQAATTTLDALFASAVQSAAPSVPVAAAQSE